MSRPEIIVEPNSQVIHINTTYNGPRELVFKAYTDPDLIPQWYGPRFLTTEVDKLEARPGGQWRFLNRDDEGNVYAFHGVYHDVVAPELIVQTFEYEGMPGHVVLETAVFEDLGGGKTRVATQSVFQSIEDRDGMVASGMEVGINDGYDRMNELMAMLQKA